MVRVLDVDIIVGIAVVPVDIISAAIRRNAGIDTQTIPVGANAKDVLGDIDKGPCRSTGQPAVFCFTVSGSVCAGNHLCINVRLGAVDVTDIFQISGTGFTIYLKCAIASANDGFCDGNPGIIVAEDSGIFLVPGRVGADLSKLQVISGIGRLQEHDAVFGIQMFLDRVQGFLRKPFLYANACEDAEALGFDKDLTFFTFPGADLVTVGIVGPEEPFPVPAGIQDCLIDCCNLLTGTDCLHSIAEKRDKLRVLFPIFNEHSGNKYGFCDRTLTWSKGLEGFAGLCGKTV